MSKKKQENAQSGELQVDEISLFDRVAEIIETRKTRAGAYANREVTLMFWEIGRYINSVVLDGRRAEYGKRILSLLASKLVDRYGKSFELRNLHRMVQFANEFPDIEIVSALTTQLSWTHFVEILSLQTEEARLYYANDAVQRHLSRNVTAATTAGMERSAMTGSGVNQRAANVREWEKPGWLWCRLGEYVYVEKMRKRSPLQHNVVLALKGHCIATVLKGQNVYNPQRELGVGDHPTRFIAPTGRNRAGAR